MRIKKKLSLLLCIVVTMLIAAPSTVAFGAKDENGKCDCDKLPLVYVVGRSDVYKNPDAPESERVDAVHAEDGEIGEAVKAVLPYFAKAVLTDDWDEYCDKLVEAVEPFFESYTLDNEGNVDNGSGVTYKWSEETLRDNHHSDSVYSYEYRYDPRLDPWETADDLNNYIEAVERVTGHDQVCLLSRCMGTSIAMTYLVKYASQNNYADIAKFEIYNGTLNGFTIINQAFTGNLDINPDGIDRYATAMLGDDYLNTFLKSSVSMLNKINGFDLPVNTIRNIYSKIYENVVPKILVKTYGAIPGYWTMVSQEYYNRAKDFVFSNTDEDYSVLIEKLDRYHNTVANNNNSTILSMKDAGVDIAIICKYGSQVMPIVKDCNVQSDNTVDLYYQSFGATCSDVDKTLSDEYIQSVEQSGKGKYISDDKQVDASTCLLPENTWFIKDIDHMVFPDGISPLLVGICRFDGEMTIETNESFPQFLLYDEESDSLSALTEENGNTNTDWNKGFFRTLFDFLESFFKFIKNYIGSLFAE